MSDEIKIGDIIEINKDQYGRPKFEVDPITRKVTSKLQKFRVVSVDEYGAKLEPIH